MHDMVWRNNRGARWGFRLAACVGLAFWAGPVVGQTPVPSPTPTGSAPPAVLAVEGIFAGQPLREALARLQVQGLSLVFSDRLVGPGLRVVKTPSASDPRAVLDELLSPHGLAVRERAGGRLLVVRSPGGGETGGTSPGSAEEQAEGPVATFEEAQQIEVVASHPWILGDELSTYTLDRDALENLPDIGNDTLRRLSHLPGTASSETSAELHIRGGRADEVMIRLDGHEVVAPYHLQDYGNALSSLATEAVGEARLFTGGFPAEFGDRMGGVLDLTTADPEADTRRELAVSPLELAGSVAGIWDGGRRAGLLVLRGGSLELPFKVADEADNPRYADVFAKVETRVGERHTLRGHILAAGDWLDFREERDERIEAFRTHYDSFDGWLTYQWVGSRRALVLGRLSFGRIDRDRRGDEVVEEGEVAPGGFSLRDERQLDNLALALDGHWRLGSGGGSEHHLRWGVDARMLDVEYDYSSTLADPGPLPASRRFVQGFDGEQLAFYAADRWRSGRWTLDLGLRLDRNTVLDDNHFFSPRLSLGVELGERSLLRANWGRYTQSQRLYELQVEDGETELTHSERADHTSLGFEHVFASRSGGRGTILRLELHDRRVQNPRTRWENLFEPISKVPELAPDRVRIAPTSSRSRGVELFVGGPAGQAFDWFATYAYARAEDRIDGRDVPRRIDQPHALHLDLAWHGPARRWRIALAFEGHTGWPTTEVSGRLVEGADGEPLVERVLGPLYGERLRDYTRLDLGIRRFWQLSRGELMAFLTVQNLLGRRNLRGFEVTFGVEDGEVITEKTAKSWGGVWPSFGVRWSF